MNIRLQCRPNISVAQKLTEALDVHTILHAPCRVGMSEGVKIPIADTAAFQQLPVSVLQCARFHRRVRVGQKIIVSLNALGGRFSNSSISLGMATRRTELPLFGDCTTRCVPEASRTRAAERSIRRKPER